MFFASSLQAGDAMLLPVLLPLVLRAHAAGEPWRSSVLCMSETLSKHFRLQHLKCLLHLQLSSAHLHCAVSPVQDPLLTLRGSGMLVTKIIIFLFGATVLAVCAWGMTRTDPGIVEGAFGVVLQVRVSTCVLIVFC